MIENVNYMGSEYSIRSLQLPSRKLTEEDAAFAKFLINLGCHIHKIAAILGVNPGRIAEIKTGHTFWWVQPLVS